MQKQLAFLLLSTCILSACSTYKTNSTTTFTSTLLSGQTPAIHVGEIKEKPDKLVLLGWVEASVSKPSILAKNPTQEQANIILAEKGVALGADAIIYVTYKTRVGTLFLEKIEARGQAVKLKDNTAQLEGIKPQRKTVEAPTPIAEPDTATQPPMHEKIPAITESDEASNDNDKLTTIPADVPAPVIRYEDRNNEENIPTTVEQAMQIKASTASTSTAPVSLKAEVAQKNKEKAAQQLDALAEQAKRCEPTLNDIAEYESDYDALNYLIMNADFLLKKSRSMNDSEMESASLRLTQLLEQQLAKLKANKPVLPE